MEDRKKGGRTYADADVDAAAVEDVDVTIDVDIVVDVAVDTDDEEAQIGICLLHIDRQNIIAEIARISIVDALDPDQGSRNCYSAEKTIHACRYTVGMFHFAS